MAKLFPPESSARTASLRTQIQHHGVRQSEAVEAQVASTNPTARAAFDKMGFTPVDESIIYRKD